jgi:signal recognition particle receptor subunit beta
MGMWRPTATHPTRPPTWRRVQMLLATESLASTPFLILGNKVDMPHAASEGELRAALNIMETTGKEVTRVAADGAVRPIEVR